MGLGGARVTKAGLDSICLFVSSFPSANVFPLCLVRKKIFVEGERSQDGALAFVFSGEKTAPPKAGSVLRPSLYKGSMPLEAL